MTRPLWWEHRTHRCLLGWLVRRHHRRVTSRAWCENCRARPAGRDGFCSPKCRAEWQDATAF